MSLLRCWPRPGLRRYRTLVVVAALALCLLGALCLALYAETLPFLVVGEAHQGDSIKGDQRKYGVVIDAGSSGSRVMIYAWDDPTVQKREGQFSANDRSTTGLPAIERAGEQWTFKTSPGISSFAGQPRRVGAEHIRPLLDFAQRHIPRQQLRHTPVYLLATAGMRLLPRAQQSQLLDAACLFARTNYEFLLPPDCQEESFQVVSGELEGLYGWVAVNYLMDGFAKVATATVTATAAVVDGKHSLGFLDMGGASAQIAFEPAENAARIHKHDLAKVTLRSLDGTDFSHSVFVATFLGHGTNEARRRYVDILRAQAIANGDGARDSRFPVADDPCLAVGLMLPTMDGQAALRGTGRFSECVAATEPLLNNTVCPIEPCLFAGVHAPEIDFGVQRFVGVSEYWYASHDYLGLGGMWDVEKFEAQASSFCQMPWSEAIQHLDDDGGQNDLVAVARLQMQCFKAAWLVNVLHKGFGVPRGESTAEISGKTGGAGYSAPFQSVNQVGDVEVSWTLGALLLKVSGTIPGKHGTLNDAKSRPGIVLPDNPGVNEGTVELEDGSLWSPLQFVGISRLLVLWSLQPTATRVLLALTALGACSLVALLLYWLISATQLVGCCRHYRGQRQRKKPIGSGAPSPIGSGETLSPIPMGAIGSSSIRRSQQQQQPARQLLPPSPSQLGLAEAQSTTTREYEVRRSPSMFVMDLFSGSPDAEQQASKSPSPRQMPPLLPPPPISRSSSVVNLTVSSRRRGV